MKRSLLLLALLAAASPAWADDYLAARAHEQRMAMLAPIVFDTHHSSGGSYTGIGDVIAGSGLTVEHWYGLRAYSAATAGVNNLIDVHCGSTTYPIKSTAAGDLDTATISADCGANTIYLYALYDIDGTTKISQTSNPWQIVLNCTPTGKACIKTNSVGSYVSAALTLAQPFTMLSYAKQGANTGISAIAASTQGGTTVYEGFNSAGTLGVISCGTALTSNAASATFHGLAGVCNNTSSLLSVDGAATTGSAGTNSFSAVGFDLGGGTAGFGQPQYITEGGIFSGAASSTVLNALTNNEKNYYGQ